jgi:hypothetical protein
MYTVKKEKEFSSYIMKFRRDVLQILIPVAFVLDTPGPGKILLTKEISIVQPLVRI